MIQSILDTDLYKFSTSYTSFHKFNRARLTKFNDRNKEDWRIIQTLWMRWVAN